MHVRADGFCCQAAVHWQQAAYCAEMVHWHPAAYAEMVHWQPAAYAEMVRLKGTMGSPAALYTVMIGHWP